jgi:hypothetical protein
MLIEVTPSPQTGTVPEGYFDNFADNMLQLIRKQNSSHELADIAPTLAGISKEMPYHVPAGYFEQLTPALPQPAKVVSMSSKKNVVAYGRSSCVAHWRIQYLATQQR